jgi:hypothetical protein
MSRLTLIDKETRKQGKQEKVVEASFCPALLNPCVPDSEAISHAVF